MTTVDTEVNQEHQVRKGSLDCKRLHKAINFHYILLFGMSIFLLILALVVLFVFKSDLGSAFLIAASIVLFLRLLARAVIFRQRDKDIETGVYGEFEYTHESIILFCKTKFRKEIPYKDLLLLDFRIDMKTGSSHVLFQSKLEGDLKFRGKWIFPLEEQSFYELLSYLLTEKSKDNPNIADMTLLSNH